MSTITYTLAESDVASYLRGRMKSRESAGFWRSIFRAVRRALGQ
jgi:hypothetical protein